MVTTGQDIVLGPVLLSPGFELASEKKIVCSFIFINVLK